EQFAEHRPVLLIDVQEVRIYAYPYEEIAGDLSQRSQATLAKQYAEACQTQRFVVFVRDNVEKKLVSYTVGGPNDTHPEVA
ncbi:MAG: hypothetical protein ACO1SX_14825, partial [Actinomycetota bacterium]